MRKLTALAVATALLGTTSLALANGLGWPCTAAPQSRWLSLDALQGKVEALGYAVRKGKLKNACGEFYATDKNGAHVELFVDPTNGTLMGRL